MMKKYGIVLLSTVLAASLLVACFPVPQAAPIVNTAEVPAEMVAKTVQAELTQISISTLVMQLTNANIGGQLTPTIVTEAPAAATATPEPLPPTLEPTAVPATATLVPPTATMVPPTNTAVPPVVNTSAPSQPRATATRLSPAALTQTATVIPVVYITPISGYKTPVPGYRTPVPTVQYGTAVPYKSPTPNVTPISCYRARLVSETIPDGTLYGVSSPFTKSWTLQNTGTCTWTPEYDWWFTSGDQMSGPAFTDVTATVPPGGTMTISVNLVAPASQGEYVGYYQLRGPTGQLFGWGADSTGGFWVKIVVR